MSNEHGQSAGEDRSGRTRRDSLAHMNHVPQHLEEIVLKNAAEMEESIKAIVANAIKDGTYQVPRAVRGRRAGY